jgi:putative peptide zinc metalloprotease protein
MPTQRFRLEFLIRKRDGGGGSGIELRGSDPAQVWLRLRPRRVPDLPVEENPVEQASGRVVVLRNVASNDYVHLTEREHYLWQRLDGTHTIRDLAAAWAFEFGVFDFGLIPRFLNKLRKLGVVEMPRGGLARTRPSDRGRLGRLLLRLSRLDLRTERVDGFFRRLGHGVRPLLAPRVALPLVALGLVGAGYFLARRWSAGFGAPEAPFAAWLGGVALLLLPTLALHELAHGAACRAFGRRVKALGLTLLDRFVPSAYVDVTDIWMAPRRARITVSLAAPALNLLLLAATGAGAALAAVNGAGAAAWWLRTAADANLILFAWTSWPFGGAQSDGYHALSDALRLSALRARAFRRLRQALRGRAGRSGASGAAPVAGAAGTTLYLLGSLATWAGLLTGAVLLVLG